MLSGVAWAQRDVAVIPPFEMEVELNNMVIIRYRVISNPKLLEVLNFPRERSEKRPPSTLQGRYDLVSKLSVLHPCFCCIKGLGTPMGSITFSHVTSNGLVQPWTEFPTLHPFAWDVVRDGTQT